MLLLSFLSHNIVWRPKEIVSGKKKNPLFRMRKQAPCQPKCLDKTNIVLIATQEMHLWLRSERLFSDPFFMSARVGNDVSRMNWELYLLTAAALSQRGFVSRENARRLWQIGLMNSKLMCSLLHNFSRHRFMPLHYRASFEINNKMWILLVDINWERFSIPEQNCWCWRKKEKKRKEKNKNAPLWTARAVGTCWKEII